MRESVAVYTEETMGMRPGKLSEIVIAMVRTGVVGYGGGPGTIPLFRYEAVTRFHWIDDEEFAEILALANALPGPIAPKMAAYLGYRLRGTVGAVIAILTHILPSTIAVVALMGILMAYRNNKVIHGMITAVDPVIVVLLGLLSWDFLKKAKAGLGTTLAILFGLLAFLMLAVLKWNDAIVVLAFLLYGSFHLRFVNWIRSKRSNSSRGDGH